MDFHVCESLDGNNIFKFLYINTIVLILLAVYNNRSKNLFPVGFVSNQTQQLPINSYINHLHPLFINEDYSYSCTLECCLLIVILNVPVHSQCTYINMTQPWKDKQLIILCYNACIFLKLLTMQICQAT